MISLLAGNLDLTAALISFSKGVTGMYLGKSLCRVISNSKTETNSDAEIKRLANVLIQHKVIDALDDFRSNVSVGIMTLIGYRLKMKLTVVPNDGGAIKGASVEERCDGDLGPLTSFAIDVDDVPGVPLQIAVLRQVLQKRRRAVIMNEGVKEVVTEGRTRLVLSGPTVPRTVMIKINRSNSDGTISDRRLRATNGDEWDVSTYKLRLPVQTQTGAESTIIQSLDSMIACYNTDAEKPEL